MFERLVDDHTLTEMLINARKSLSTDAKNFKFRVLQSEINGTEYKQGWVENYIIDVQPNPDDAFYFRITIPYRNTPEAYPQAVAQTIHEVERYYTLKKAKSIIRELPQQAIELLRRFKESRYIELATYLDILTDAELEQTGLTNPRKQKVLINDKSLKSLVDYGLVEIEERGIWSVAMITNLGLHAAYELTPPSP